MIQRLLESERLLALVPKKTRPPHDEQGEGEKLADGNRAPGGRNLISAARQQRPQDASAIQRIGGQQVEHADKQLRPDQAARKIEGREPGVGEQIRLRPEEN